MSYNSSSLSDILFLDIETVPLNPSYQDMPEELRDFWNKKAETLIKNPEDTPETIYQRAGIYAEFGKIICISVGFVDRNILRIKSFYSDDENLILTQFAALLRKSPRRLCAHNGKEFDFPYICRRMLVNGVNIPDVLNIQGKKPWEITHIDTMELWRFGDYKNFTSLALLASIFDIPTPKDDINGADVAKVYYEEKNLERIKIYCEKDVVALTRIYCKLSQIGQVDEVVYIGNE